MLTANVKTINRPACNVSITPSHLLTLFSFNALIAVWHDCFPDRDVLQFCSIIFNNFHRFEEIDCRVAVCWTALNILPTSTPFKKFCRSVVHFVFIFAFEISLLLLWLLCNKLLVFWMFCRFLDFAMFFILRAHVGSWLCVVVLLHWRLPPCVAWCSEQTRGASSSSNSRWYVNFHGKLSISGFCFWIPKTKSREKASFLALVGVFGLQSLHLSIFWCAELEIVHSEHATKCCCTWKNEADISSMLHELCKIKPYLSAKAWENVLACT